MLFPLYFYCNTQKITKIAKYIQIHLRQQTVRNHNQPTKPYETSRLTNALSPSAQLTDSQHITKGHILQAER